MHNLHCVALVGKLVAITREVIESIPFPPHEKEYLILHRLGLISRGDASSSKNDLEMCLIPPMQIAHLRAMVQRESGASYERMCLLKALALFSLDPRDSGFEAIGKQNGEPDTYLHFLRYALDEKFIETLRGLIPDGALNGTELERGMLSETEIELLTLKAEIELAVPKLKLDKLKEITAFLHASGAITDISDRLPEG